MVVDNGARRHKQQPLPNETTNLSALRHHLFLARSYGLHACLLYTLLYLRLYAAWLRPATTLYTSAYEILDYFAQHLGADTGISIIVPTYACLGNRFSRRYNKESRAQRKTGDPLLIRIIKKMLSYIRGLFSFESSMSE